jgi:hypothetical protein
LPIVFASGYADTAAFEVVPGATILRKPIQIAKLADAVRRRLSNTRRIAASRAVLPVVGDQRGHDVYREEIRRSLLAG